MTGPLLAIRCVRPAVPDLTLLRASLNMSLPGAQSALNDWRGPDAQDKDCLHHRPGELFVGDAREDDQSGNERRQAQLLPRRLRRTSRPDQADSQDIPIQSMGESVITLMTLTTLTTSFFSTGFSILITAGNVFGKGSS